MNRNTEMTISLSDVVIVAALVIVWGLACWFLTPPTIEVQPLGMSPAQADDTNIGILPLEKRGTVYPWVIVVNYNFRGEEYVAAYPKDAVTVTGSGADVCARIYTNDPDTTRVKRFM